MNNFSKNDRVAFAFDKTTIGTVTRCTKAETRVLWDSGHETPVDPAELVHTTQIQPPAGFRLIIDHGPWHGEYHGPEAHHGNVVVSSRWSCLGKPLIEFDVYSTVDGHSNFDREELEAIPVLIKDVLSQIDQAHAVEVMTAHPVSKKDPRWHTVTEIAVWCDTHKIDAVAGFAAFTELHGAEYGIKGGGDDA